MMLKPLPMPSSCKTELKSVVSWRVHFSVKNQFLYEVLEKVIQVILFLVLILRFNFSNSRRLWLIDAAWS